VAFRLGQLLFVDGEDDSFQLGANALHDETSEQPLQDWRGCNELGDLQGHRKRRYRMDC
jgi:hypothetical protein